MNQHKMLPLPTDVPATTEIEVGRYHSLIQSAPDGIIFMGERGMLLEVNAAFATLLNYTPEELRGHSITEFMHPDTYAGRGKTCTILPPGETLFDDRRLRRRDGSYITVEGNVSYLPNKTSFVILRDVTRRRERETELVLSEAGLRQLVELLPDPVYRVRRDGTYLAVLTRNESQLLVPPAEFIGKTLADYLRPTDVARVKEAVEEALRTGTMQTVEYYLFGYKTRLREARILPVPDSEDEVFMVMRDMTERREAEEKIQWLTDSAPCLLWQGIIVQHENDPHRFHWHLSSTSGAGMQSLLPLEVKGDMTYWRTLKEYIPAEDIRQMDEIANSALRNNFARYTNEFRCRDENGAWHWLSEEVQLHLLEPGRWQAIGVCTDITEQKEAVERLQKSERHLSLLNSLISRIHSNQQVEAIIIGAVSELASGLPGIRVSYGDIQSDGFINISAVAASGGIVHVLDVKNDLNCVPDVLAALRRKEAVVANDVQHDSRFQTVVHDLTAMNIQALVDMPLHWEGQLRGALIFMAPTTYEWQEGEINTLQEVADYLTLALEKAHAEREREKQMAQLRDAHARLQRQQEELTRLNRTLENLATTDPLTGLKNRRVLEERINAEYERCNRDNVPLSLLMLDVDRFKQYNDGFGHTAGDELLHQLGRFLQNMSREGDLVVRYGGEEFVLLLPETDVSGATQIAERIRQAVEHYDWPGRGITVSIGTATYNSTMSDWPNLLRVADLALYRAKAMGRNCVIHLSR